MAQRTLTDRERALYNALRSMLTNHDIMSSVHPDVRRDGAADHWPNAAAAARKALAMVEPDTTQTVTVIDKCGNPRQMYRPCHKLQPLMIPLERRRQPIYIDSAERATILAALRHWQHNIETNGDKRSGLGTEAIDELCERINCG